MKFMRVEDVANELNVSEETVRRWIRGRVIRAEYVGGGYKINPEDIKHFIGKPRMLTYRDAAVRYGVPVSRLRRWRKIGLLKAVEITPKSVLFPVAELERLCTERLDSARKAG